MTKILVEWVFLSTNHMDGNISHKLIIQIGTQNQSRESRHHQKIYFFLRLLFLLFENLKPNQKKYFFFNHKKYFKQTQIKTVTKFYNFFFLWKM